MTRYTTKSTRASVISRYCRTLLCTADLNLSPHVSSPACQAAYRMGRTTHARKKVVQYTVYHTLVIQTLWWNKICADGSERRAITRGGIVATCHGVMFFGIGIGTGCLQYCRGHVPEFLRPSTAVD